MFVTFEGPEGAGKSTAIATVKLRLEGAGHAVVVTREPGGSSIGPAVRDILLHGGQLRPWTEVLLFEADRHQHLEDVIEPALRRGDVVLCDRFADSTLAYQGYGRGLDLDRLRDLNEMATGGRKPDLTLLFDIEVELGLSRISNKDRLDSEPLEFHERVRQGFLMEARVGGERWVLVDASLDQTDVAEVCVREILGRLGS